MRQNRKVVSFYLKPLNLNIVEACNGVEAIEKLKNFKPEVILMDIHMPYMDGFEATKIIKADEDLKSIPVIALTASALKEQLGDILKTFNAYIRKPVSKNRLSEELAKYLPYEIINEEKKSDKSSEYNFENMKNDKISTSDTVKSEALTKVIKEEIMPELLMVQKSLYISKIKHFNELLAQKSKENNSELLTKYSNDIKLAVDSFKIDKVVDILKMLEKTLNEFIN